MDKIEQVLRKTYADYPESLRLIEAADLCGVSHPTFTAWINCNKTPMGPIEEGVHYYRIGDPDNPRREYRFIKYQLGLLFKMVPDNICPAALVGTNKS
jgi:hypothetical protein